jgi:hypothetical protein
VARRSALPGVELAVCPLVIAIEELPRRASARSGAPHLGLPRRIARVLIDETQHEVERQAPAAIAQVTEDA